MDSAGISVVSHQTLPTEAVSGVYDNKAFDGETVNEKDTSVVTAGSNGDLVNNSSPKPQNNSETTETTTSTATAVTTNNIKNSHSSENLNHNSEKSSRLYDDHAHSKRGSASVEFHMPGKSRRDMLKSNPVADRPYRGMGKEELLHFSSKPLWRNLRYVCMSVVLTGWLALLITVVALVLTYPQCRPAQDREWWQKAVIYRVYVRSFLDTQHRDGIGDLEGVRTKLDYIKETGANTISLSPFYKLSNNAPTDTHIVNHTEIEPELGTMDDFRRLVNETHARGMHITVDFIPNHTSDKHPWFIASQADKDRRTNEKRSYYVWTEEPLNNWKSVYGCNPAWTKNDINSSDYYLHQFLDTQPDLDLRSDKVKQELQDILEFWLDLGVDGFYIRDSDFLFEDYDLRDETLMENITGTNDCQSPTDHPYMAFDHHYTLGQTQNLDMLAHWRYFLDEYGNRTNTYRIMFADVEGSRHHVMDYYGLFNRDGVDFPLNSFSMYFNKSKGGLGFKEMVSGWLEHMPGGRWPNWMGGDDRSPRLVERLGPQLAKSYLLLMMLLPGTPYMYYGDEIGMRDLPYEYDEWAREKAMRSPMLWNNTHHNGFCYQTCTKPWIAHSDATVQLADIHGNIVQNGTIHVEEQMKRYDSIWNLFRNLTELRKDNPSFVYGDYTPALQDEHVFSFVREFDGEKGYLIAVNLDQSATSKYFKGTHSTIPGGATVELVSGMASGHRKGKSVDLDPLHLAAHEGIVVSWDYEAKEL